jgi:hypothetical protein
MVDSLSLGMNSFLGVGLENNAVIVNQDKATAHVIAGTLNDLGLLVL